MTIPQKLQIIQKMLKLTQTKLAEKFGVSFVSFNNWWTGKIIPRSKNQEMINNLFLEVTGQKTIPNDRLESKKDILKRKSLKYKNIVEIILKNPDIRDQLILMLTYHTNSIEGSSLTESETSAILFDNVALPNKTLNEQLEAKNHQTALNFLLDYIADKKKINEELILKLHSILMNGVRSDAGKYRNHAVRIVGVNLPTTNYLSVPRLISGVISEAGSKTNDIISLATKVHSRFEQIHPFSDGNGRVGRLLINAMLLTSNLAPAIIKQEKKQLYYAFLYKAQTKDDNSQLEDFLCDAIEDGFKILERKD